MAFALALGLDPGTVVARGHRDARAKRRYFDERGAIVASESTLSPDVAPAMPDIYRNRTVRALPFFELLAAPQ